MARLPAFLPQDALVLRDEIRGRRLRATSARVAVLWALRKSKSPPSHPQLADRLTGFGLDQATVYRNLLDLTKAGLARRIEVGDHTWRFEAVAPGKSPKDHPHFVCDVCGTITCLGDLDLVLKSASAKWIERRPVKVLVQGRCDDCG